MPLTGENTPKYIIPFYFLRGFLVRIGTFPAGLDYSQFKALKEKGITEFQILYHPVGSDLVGEVFPGSAKSEIQQEEDKNYIPHISPFNCSTIKLFGKTDANATQKLGTQKNANKKWNFFGIYSSNNMDVQAVFRACSLALGANPPDGGFAF